MYMYCHAFERGGKERRKVSREIVGFSRIQSESFLHELSNYFSIEGDTVSLEPFRGMWFLRRIWLRERTENKIVKFEYRGEQRRKGGNKGEREETYMLFQTP